MFAREASENPQLKAYLEHVILLKNDCEKGAGVDLAKTYQVRVYPTFAMVNHAGEVTDRWAGYPGVAGFVEIVDAALADPRTIAEKEQAFAAEPTLALGHSLGRYSEAVFANQDAVRYYRKAMELDPDHAGDLSGKVFMAMYYGVRGGDFTPEEVVQEGKAILMADSVDPGTALSVAGVTRHLAAPEEYKPLLKAALAATRNATGDMAEARKDLEIDAALLLENDRPKAMMLKRGTLPEGWYDDPGELNSFAWWCYENNLNLDEALTLALRGAELASSDADRANILDTAAEIAFKQGDTKQAIELETRAVELAPDRDGFKKTLQKFQGTLGS
ncbi:MAG: hypothetical protein R3D98_11305 [Candidatus Krumholzibacteriia bacterium]